MLTINNQTEMFLKAVYNPSDQVCAGSLYSKEVFPICEVSPRYHEFITINPVLGGRADSNVTEYRNILLESDGMSINEQEKVFESLGLPFTTKVFSGSKSLHYIISLDEPYTTREEYSKIVRRLYAGLRKLGYKCDKNNSNPSRFTRNPGYQRRSAGIQTLLQVNEKVSKQLFEEWVYSNCPELPDYKAHQSSISNKYKLLVPQWVSNFLVLGLIKPGESRHNILMKVFFQLRDYGVEKEDACERVLRILPNLNENQPREVSEDEVMKLVDWVYSQERDNK